MDYYDTTTYEQADPAAGSCCCSAVPEAPAPVEPVVDPAPAPVAAPVVEQPVAPAPQPVASAPVAMTEPTYQAPSIDSAAQQSVAVVGGPTPGINTVIEPGTQILPNVATIGGPTPGFDTVIEPGSPILPNVATIGGPTPGIAPLTESSGQILPNVAVVGKPTYGAFGALLDSGNPQLASTAAALIANQQGQADIMFRPSASELQLMRHLGYR